MAQAVLGGKFLIRRFQFIVHLARYHSQKITSPIYLYYFPVASGFDGILRRFQKIISERPVGETSQSNLQKFVACLDQIHQQLFHRIIANDKIFFQFRLHNAGEQRIGFRKENESIFDSTVTKLVNAIDHIAC